jgi:hypothetical protein
MRRRNKSDRHQPAMGVSNAVAIADAFVQGPALPRRWSQTTFATATRWISAFRVRIPRTSHGGLTPPALGAERTFAGEKTIFAMHERAFTRAAGVSPPWYRKTHLQRRVIFVEWLRLPLHNRLRLHGGLTPPALVAERTFVGEKTIFAMHERTSTRAAGVSPPWVLGKRTCRNASAKSRGTAGGVLTNAGGVALANHGGLTPPALTLQSERSPAKKRFLRRRNAGLQERRA